MTQDKSGREEDTSGSVAAEPGDRLSGGVRHCASADHAAASRSSDGPGVHMNPREIEELEALLAKATPGPWEFRPTHWGEGWIVTFAVADGSTSKINGREYTTIASFKTFKDWPNGFLAASAVNALPRLLSTLRALQAENGKLRSLIRECRLADGYAARTGDESRFDRAFHALCAAEKPSPPEPSHD